MIASAENLLRQTLSRGSVTWRWIKGHSNEPGNDLADHYAKLAGRYTGQQGGRHAAPDHPALHALASLHPEPAPLAPETLEARIWQAAVDTFPPGKPDHAARGSQGRRYSYFPRNKWHEQPRI